MKPILIHTHFHRRRTGITRSIENVMPYFKECFEPYVYGYNVDGKKISKSQLRKVLFSNSKVVVHCHRNNEILKMLFWRLLGAKFTLIATRHAETKPSNLSITLLKKADKVVTLINSMGNALGIDNIVVGHGVNIDLFTPNTSKKIAHITQQNLIICAGRVREAKGQITLLEASSVLQKHKNWALVIVGKVDKPPFLELLKNISKKHNIQNQVYFIDETSDIISYYQAAKIAVVPSFSEGFSLVTAEAMACQCSVIATKNVGVHSELIGHHKNGYLFEAGNIEALQELLEKSITQQIPNLGEQARAEIVKNWSAQKEARELIQLYQSK
ncbi:glycosyltransferase family 4 protein [uncultured Polaribacter sp.]|uniref:glycosyltransferase family 4 protein n=1 Tax=uncultured Polaribacter sp. TaxID=174711 RepID=UPI0026087A7B|nr:glycosyltransferase family 4 protein [uncultured Polaribacter sp.]